VAQRHQNFGHSGEGLFEPNDVLKTPLSLSVSKRTEAWIVIIHGVNAGLDMHWIRRFRVNANQRPNLVRPLSVLRRKLAAVDALVLAEMESRCGPIV
jgi:hypothetical protein